MEGQNAFEFFCRVKINSGSKSLEMLPFELQALDAGKPLLMGGGNASLKPVIEAFGDSGMTIGAFEGISGESPVESMVEVAKLYRMQHYDALIAVGDTGVANAAKAVNLMVSTGAQNPDQFEGMLKVAKPLRPLVVVVGSRCTGNEVSSRIGVGKADFSSPYLMPDLALIDPRMLEKTGPGPTAQAALAGLTRAVESGVGVAANPISGSYASSAIRLFRKHLLAAVRHPADKTARLALVNAAVMAGCAAADTPPGMTRRLGEAVEAICPAVPAGIAMGVLLPYVLEYISLKYRFPTADLLLPLVGAERFAGTAEHLRAPIAVNTIYALQYDLNKAEPEAIPLTLEDAGVDKDHLEAIALQVPSREDDLHMVLRHAWEGRPIVAL